MQKKNIIVTGGLGFIGSHIVDELIDKNKITIIDDKSTGKLENLENPNHENLKLVIGNLNDLNLNELFKGIDCIFHLAALANVPKSVENPLFNHENNVNATLKLLIAAKNNNVKKIVFSSSSAIYGDNPNMPLKEKERPSPSSPYAASKASCELYCQSFTESYNLATVSLRYFNVFGEKQDVNSQYAAVIPNFIYSLINSEQPVIYGDGEQSRDFIYVKDVVKANITACESDYNGVLNVASGRSLTINDLFKIVKKVLNSDIDPKYLDERPGDIKHSLANVENLKNIDCEINQDLFEKNLKKTIKWFKNNQ
ncbi:MAG: NAD-dependent epimerase/dehydratase family protein [Methanobacteriaceae archaeon]|jgi:UDP-glucose 4-epimerase|nr:NAD-dependent epimerase/dehydratase family protein [Candidatus Methanorudis spinitermitis]